MQTRCVEHNVRKLGSQTFQQLPRDCLDYPLLYSTILLEDCIVCTYNFGIQQRLFSVDEYDPIFHLRYARLLFRQQMLEPDTGNAA